MELPKVTSNIQQQVATSSKILKRFLFSQYFADGLRITLGILLPAVIAYNYGHINEGIATSLGALCVSIPDTPGPFQHRRNAMLITLAFIFGMALLTALLAKYTILLALFIGVSCFFFSMMHVFGAGAASMGVSALAVMILGIDQNISFTQALIYALLVAGGGFWYFLLSLSNQKLLPFRAAEQLLGECTFAIAEFIRLKAGFYNQHLPIENQYNKIIAQQALVNEFQEHVREILFRTRKIMVDSSPNGRTLLLTFIDLVDLYEQSMATHYNYNEIRNKFAHTGILHYFEQVITQMADELEHLGNNLHNHEHKKPIHHFTPKLNLVKAQVDELEERGMNTMVLKKILINLRNISNRLEHIYKYKNTTDFLPEHRKKELSKFVQPQLINWAIFIAHLNFQSNHFRHALRLSIICVAAFVFARTVYQTQYSYWILLSILVILKPGFSYTKKRNYERVIGTIIGGLIGLVILKYFPGVNARLAFLSLLMLLAFSFMRVNYVISVLFMTPYVLIVFSFTGNDSGLSVAWERILDTIIGASLALAASYFIFPNWESYQLKSICTDLVKANLNYLKSIMERNETPASQSNYRLSRKQLFVNTSNLSTAFQRMLSEPKSKQSNGAWVMQFSILNNQLSSYFATLSYQLKPGESLTAEQKRAVRSIYNSLLDGLEKNESIPLKQDITFANGDQNNTLSTEFLVMVHQTATDLKKHLQQTTAFN